MSRLFVTLISIRVCLRHAPFPLSRSGRERPAAVLTRCMLHCSRFVCVAKVRAFPPVLVVHVAQSQTEFTNPVRLEWVDEKGLHLLAPYVAAPASLQARGFIGLALGGAMAHPRRMRWCRGGLGEPITKHEVSVRAGQPLCDA